MNIKTIVIPISIYYLILLILSINTYEIEIVDYGVATGLFLYIMYLIITGKNKKNYLIVFLISTIFPFFITFNEKIKLEKIESYCIKDKKLILSLDSKKNIFIEYPKLSKERKSYLKNQLKNNQCYIKTKTNKGKLIYKDFTIRFKKDLICMPKKISKLIESKLIESKLIESKGVKK